MAPERTVVWAVREHKYERKSPATGGFHCLQFSTLTAALADAIDNILLAFKGVPLLYITEVDCHCRFYRNLVVTIGIYWLKLNLIMYNCTLKNISSSLQNRTLAI